MYEGHFIGGHWLVGGGGEFESVDPSTGKVLWRSRYSSGEDVDAAVEAARLAADGWRRTSVDERKSILMEFGRLVEKRAELLAEAIASDNGKPLWEARTEVTSLKTKIDATVAAFEERATDRIQDIKGRKSVTRFRPHGVMAVLGPFNFPMSMPNSHVMPAIYAGNTVVLKPSEHTPAAAVAYVRTWEDAGLPPGVLNLIQGNGPVGKALAGHADVNGVLFIGSHKTGMSLAGQLATETGKQLTLEMGGNAPLVVWSYSDIRSAVHIVVQSAYISAGQRCTAARRLVVNNQIAETFLAELTRAISAIQVGRAQAEQPPFMGPMITAAAAENFAFEVSGLVDAGARVLVAPDPVLDLGPAFVRPGLIDITDIEAPDEEIFGPLLQVMRVDTFEKAITVANATRYGLAAGIVATDRADFERFLDATKAGIVNWNQPITGATTFAPFGGVKASGNFRPAGFLSVDYCSYATASIEDESPSVPEALPPGVSY